MTIFTNPSNFEIVEFYTYPTTVVNRLVEWDEGFHPGGDEDIKDLFDDLLQETENKVGKDLRDNKIAIKVIYKPTNTEMYIGYKDWNWCVGLKLNPYQCGSIIKINN